MIIRRPITDIEEDVIRDYAGNMNVLEIEKKYGWSWTTLRKMFKRKKIPFRPLGGYRKEAGRHKPQPPKGVDYNVIINDRTLKEWQEYNTKVNNKSKHFKIF